MDHQEAVRLQAADRYLLGELSAAELEGFEDHYFGCVECAQEVMAGERLRTSLRVVLREQRAKAESRVPAQGWLDWLFGRPAMAASMAVACLLLALTAYQQLVVVPGLRTELAQANAPQSYQSFALRSLARGDDYVLGLPRGAGFAGLRIDLDPESRFGRYRAEILDKSGSRLFSIDSPPPRQLGDPLEFLVPAASIPAGSYTLVIHGLSDEQPGRETEIGRYRFSVVIK
jgi:hypothetical protein